MAFKDILVILSAEELNGARLATAAHLARDTGARVTGICLYDRPEAPFADAWALGSRAVSNVLDREDARLAFHLKPVERHFHAAMAGVEAVWAAPVDNLAREIALKPIACDLVIAGATGSASDLALIDWLVTERGGPCLIAPEDRVPARAFDRVAIGWNGSAEIKRAVADALPILERAVHVQIVAAAAPGRAADPVELEAAVAHLARHGVTASACWVSSPHQTAAECLEGFIRDHGVDLLVLGAYSHSRAAEVVFGGVTRYLLRDPPTAILASR